MKHQKIFLLEYHLRKYSKGFNMIPQRKIMQAGVYYAIITHKNMCTLNNLQKSIP